MKKTLFFLIFTTTIFVFFACQEKIQGCLDPNATNFEVAADEACLKTSTSSGCPCRYPNLVLGADFKVAGKTKKGLDTLYNWDGNFPLKNAANQTYFFKTMALYLSDIQLVRANGDVVNTIDSVVIPIQKSAVDTPNVKVRKDFTLLNSNNFNYNIGAFSQNGDLPPFRFFIILVRRAMCIGGGGFCCQVVGSQIRQLLTPLRVSSNHQIALVRCYQFGCCAMAAVGLAAPLLRL